MSSPIGVYRRTAPASIDVHIRKDTALKVHSVHRAKTGLSCGEKAITDTEVAGYLAKYPTKGTDDAGHVSARITTDTVDIYTDLSHPGR